MRYLVGLLIFIAFFSVACKNTAKEKEIELLKAYLTKKNIDSAVGSGYYYVELKKGNGDTAKQGDSVFIYYTGTLIDEKKFHTYKKGGPAFRYIFKDNKTIKGLEEAVSQMSSGTKSTLIIPSDLAYGKKRSGAIPPYSTLILTIDSFRVKPK